MQGKRVLDSLGLLLNRKGPAMNLTLSLLLVIFSALCIHLDLANEEDDIYNLNPRKHMFSAAAQKTKRGWICGGVLCPKERTSSCKTTNILQPTEKLQHDLLVVCLDANQKVFCGISRSSRIMEKEVIEVADDGNMDYKYRDTIVTLEGKSIPRCVNKKTR